MILPYAILAKLQLRSICRAYYEHWVSTLKKRSLWEHFSNSTNSEYYTEEESFVL